MHLLYNAYYAQLHNIITVCAGSKEEMETIDDKFTQGTLILLPLLLVLFQRNTHCQMPRMGILHAKKRKTLLSSESSAEIKNKISFKITIM